MKLSLFVFLYWGISLSVYSQERDKEPHYNYLLLTESVYTNSPGTFKQKTFNRIEAGRTFGIFDVGFSVGRLSLMHSDTSWFAEILPTINVFSKGRFSEAFTIGAGDIINAKEDFLTEITNNINFAPNNYFSVSLYEGNYFFDGKFSTSKAQFIGLSLTYNFIKKNTITDVKKRKSLLN